MNQFVFFSDSSVDLPEEIVAKYQMQIIPLHLLINQQEMDLASVESHAFYERLRAGEVASTSAPNVEEFTARMEPFLKDGKDILYLGFSEALSCAFQNGKIAMEDLAEAYPERKLYAVSSLCASTGQGLLAVLAAQKMQEGASIEEVRDFLEANKLHLCHWFTVDDLMFLKRGGRISAATALAGTVLGIKPVLHVDNQGRLINVSKARGRKASIAALFEKAKTTAIQPETQVMAICHGDCLEEAEALAVRLKQELGVREVIISPTGTVIGAHSGPGTLALFFLGTQR